MSAKKRVFFLSQLAEPGHIEANVFAEVPGGEDEVFWFSMMLDRIGVLDRIDFRGLHVERGDSLPEFDEVDGAFLGGSYHMVEDDLPWQRDLQAWLAGYRQTGKPLMGICGGHQQMAATLGGTVSEIAEGPMAGSLPVDVTADGQTHFLFRDLGGRPMFHFGNYQHVSSPPAGAAVLATRPEMPGMALDYGGNWVSVQFHPEADRDIFARSWCNTRPDWMDRHIHLPEAPRMLVNYLSAMNLLDA